MNILVCIKRVPAPGTRIVLSEDNCNIVTRNLGFTISPHEECAIEAAIRLKEKHGGQITALTLGSELASEQLRYAMAMGVDDAILLETDGNEWDPMATSKAIYESVKDMKFDLLLFGNESADSGGYQVGIRVAYFLGYPCLSGIKSIELLDGKISAQRESSSGLEIYEVPLPAVISVKEGINLPRYPSLPGRMRARRKQITQLQPEQIVGGPEKVQLMIPAEAGSQVEILGSGSEVIPKVITILRDLKLIDG